MKKQLSVVFINSPTKTGIIHKSSTEVTNTIKQCLLTCKRSPTKRATKHRDTLLKDKKCYTLSCVSDFHHTHTQTNMNTCPAPLFAFIHMEDDKNILPQFHQCGQTVKYPVCQETFLRSVELFLKKEMKLN